MIIHSVEELEQLRKTIYTHADTVFEKLKERMTLLDSTAFLAEIKFGRLGVDPIKGTELNFIEQINQMFSDLVVLEGAASLLRLYPGKELKLCLGSSSGYDIESTDGVVAAECFAVTTVSGNRKLEKDCLKLMGKAPDKEKHIYYYSRYDSEEKMIALYERYPDITFTRITDFTR